MSAKTKTKADVAPETEGSGAQTPAPGKKPKKRRRGRKLLRAVLLLLLVLPEYQKRAPLPGALSFCARQFFTTPFLSRMFA